MQYLGKQRPPSEIYDRLWFFVPKELNRIQDLTLVNAGKKIRDGPQLAQVEKILFPLQASRRLDSWEPHDLFYALLSIVPMSIKPDYQKPMRQVYLEWAQGLLLGDPTLGVLFLQYSGIGMQMENRYSLPSWIPDLHQRPKKEPTRLKTMHSYPGEDLQSWFQPIKLQDEDVLCICGTQCGEIEPLFLSDRHQKVEELFIALFLIIFFIEVGKESTGVSQLQTLFTTLLQSFGRVSSVDYADMETQILAIAFATRYLTLKDTPRDTAGLKLVVQEALGLLSVQSEDFLPQAVLAKLLEPNGYAPDFRELNEDQIASNLTDATFKMEEIVGKAQTFFCLPSGQLGGGSSAVKEGDRVCILSHCKGPVILRQQGAHWLYVGPCFVHGLSDGEAFTLIDEGKLVVEEFCIR
jgi:hypothetical protein